jgi:hypothetical protein
LNALNAYDPLLKVPQDVVLAARTVARWVAANMTEITNISIYGIGVRTFLSVQDMRQYAAPEVRICELACEHEWAEYHMNNALSPHDPARLVTQTKCMKCGATPDLQGVERG